MKNGYEKLNNLYFLMQETLTNIISGPQGRKKTHLFKAFLKKSVWGGFINSITTITNNININHKTALARMPEPLPDRPQETESSVHAVHRFPVEKQQPEPSYSRLPSCYSGKAGSFECTFNIWTYILLNLQNADVCKDVYVKTTGSYMEQIFPNTQVVW